MPIYALGDLVPQIHQDAYVHPDATVIGDVRIGPQVSVWPQAVLRGDAAPITIGARSNVQDGSVVHVAPGTPTSLGAGSVIAHSVHVEGATIGDGCLIASGSVVLNSSVIEDGGVVGAGAVVSYNGRVAGGEIALGVPAKVRENRSVPAELIAYIVANYVERAAWYAKELRRLD